MRQACNNNFENRRKTIDANFKNFNEKPLEVENAKVNVPETVKSNNPSNQRLDYDHCDF
jgi:16S rRNA A1518/A1519 N6-dimethyltransferase RsmA/KsgA/DIM1 with predicted DNA glycosylase/AP lyase activity